VNAINFYRLSHWMYMHKVPLVPKFLKALIYFLFNSVVPYQCKIGAKSKFAYGGIGVVLHSRCEIGSRVIIGQGVTVGRQLSPHGVPKIGNDVYISAGSRILGNVVVGDNVIIGANSVVIQDIPSNSIVAGAPTKVIRNISDNIYDLMEGIY